MLVDLDRASGARDLFVTGDAVNTAARLQSVGRARHDRGRARTRMPRRATSSTTRSCQPAALKGKAQLVVAWRAVSVKARRGGLRSPLGIEAPLIGRDRTSSIGSRRPSAGRRRTAGRTS